ncbi:MAG: prepilin-type N-terminal cleavage/methylation domain-containing protein [Phycisphaeraceae bacterium]|nr:prepilin-type N-terminal cleavage/methylation domain-containing protein [Phycisphaeraceae bacterium]
MRSARSLATRSNRPRRRRGFTLIETSLALIVIGVGVLAFIDAQRSFIEQNNWSSRAATGALLANEVRELTRHLPKYDPVLGLSGGANNTVIGWGAGSEKIIVRDFNCLTDFDGKIFGRDGNMPGPVSADGTVVPMIDSSGVAQLDGNGAPKALEGWAQSVTVEKVDPLNFATVRSKGYFVSPSGNDPGVAIDQFPLRVTVVVTHQDTYDTQPVEVTRLIWITP